MHLVWNFKSWYSFPPWIYNNPWSYYNNLILVDSFLNIFKKIQGEPKSSINVVRKQKKFFIDLQNDPRRSKYIADTVQKASEMRSLKRVLFNAVFKRGKRKTTAGVRSGEYDGWSITVTPRWVENWCTRIVVWAGVLLTRMTMWSKEQNHDDNGWCQPCRKKRLSSSL